MAADKPNSVVVTGAAGDLGGAVVDSFLADGYRVYGGDVAPIRARPGLIASKLDVTERAQVFALAKQAAAESALKVWVNVAGLFEAARVIEADPDVWNTVIAINLTGTFHGCAAALSVMAGAGGRIVNVGSLSGQLGGLSVHPAYGASKAGVHALTKAYALEGAKHDVYCNAVAPGPIDGRMTAKFSPGTLAKIRASIPGKRLATMDEVVHAIRYLADDRAGHTTGAILQVNGGVLMTG
ncbi:MAG: SDR family oxidoreductase [Alphaproteobacteria bacterium]|nr:SDR family oxidoreductase [Alphaproteobacteria bacterium]